MTEAEDSEADMSFTFDRLVEHMPGTAAITLSATNDVLSYNQLAYQLFFFHLDLAEQWNTHRLLFTDPYTRDLYRYWNEEASLAVASLRFHAASTPDDTAVQALVGELCVTSREFARLWAGHPVRRCTRGTKHLIHPEYGTWIWNTKSSTPPTATDAASSSTPLLQKQPPQTHSL